MSPSFYGNSLPVTSHGNSHRASVIDQLSVTHGSGRDTGDMFVFPHWASDLGFFDTMPLTCSEFRNMLCKAQAEQPGSHKLSHRHNQGENRTGISTLVFIQFINNNNNKHIISYTHTYIYTILIYYEHNVISALPPPFCYVRYRTFSCPLVIYHGHRNWPVDRWFSIANGQISRGYVLLIPTRAPHSTFRGAYFLTLQHAPVLGSDEISGWTDLSGWCFCGCINLDLSFKGRSNNVAHVKICTGHDWNHQPVTMLHCSVLWSPSRISGAKYGLMGASGHKQPNKWPGNMSMQVLWRSTLSIEILLFGGEDWETGWDWEVHWINIAADVRICKGMQNGLASFRTWKAWKRIELSIATLNTYTQLCGYAPIWYTSVISPSNHVHRINAEINILPASVSQQVLQESITVNYIKFRYSKNSNRSPKSSSKGGKLRAVGAPYAVCELSWGTRACFQYLPVLQDRDRFEIRTQFSWEVLFSTSWWCQPGRSFASPFVLLSLPQCRLSRNHCYNNLFRGPFAVKGKIV